MSAAPRKYRAPGRVNLIGEHTDYTGGLVLPMAIEFATTVAASAREDRRIVAHSEIFGETCEIGLDQSPARRGHWSDYVAGVAVTLVRAGVAISGADLLIGSSVPLGAGLSSSAALEVAVALALLPAPIAPAELARLCQRAENEFVGVQCGIMDQFIATHARAGSALLLDCRSLKYQYVPLPPGVKIVIANSMVRHLLAAGEYNQRRAECAQAEACLGSLRDSQINEVAALPEPVARRARHVISENARVLEAQAAMARGDVEAFGNLMYESHRSLREDFEVSCAELDTLVEIARGVEGVYGSRMTGGGFGGCTVSLVAQDRVEALLEAIRSGYPAAEVYVSDAAGAAGEVPRSR